MMKIQLKRLRQLFVVTLCVYCLSSGLFTQVVRAEATINSWKQVFLGYRGNLGSGDAIVSTVEAACLAWPSYSRRPTNGEGWYVFLGVEPGAGGYFTCKTRIDWPSPHWPSPQGEPYTQGTVGAVYHYVCESPSVLVNGSSCAAPPKPPCDKCTPHPIHIANGEKVLAQTAYSGSTVFPLELTLHYSSLNSVPVVPLLPGSLTPTSAGLQLDVRNSNYELACTSRANDPHYALVCPVVDPKYSMAGATAPGTGWQHSGHLGISTLSNGTVAALARANGKAYIFRLIGGVWKSDLDVAGKLIKLVDGSGAASGWEYSNTKDEIEHYDSLGKLSSVSNRNGLKHTYAYDATGRVNTITDSFNRQLKLTYDTANRLSSLIDPANQVTTYAYDDNNNLASVTFPDEKSKTYLYEDTRFPHALTAVVDENNKRYMNYHYDAQGKAISEEHLGNINHYQLAFDRDAKTTTVTNPLGTAYVTRFQNSLGVDKIASETQAAGSGSIAAMRSFTYDANGNIATSTDWKNTLTTYAYDLTRNLETSRVEAAGTPQARTISTIWHAKFRIPVQINEPLRRTLYAHDANGNVLVKNVQATSDANGSQGSAAALVGTARRWTYTYNSLGQVLTLVGPRTDKTTYSYDAQGNLATISNAAGHLSTLANYDAHGHVGSITDPNGVVTTLSYHPRGWLTSRTVSAGSLVETSAYEYDGVGQMIMVTLPDNSKINYTYDDAHRLTDISDSHQNSIHYELDNMGNRIHESIKGSGGDIERQVSRIYDALNRLQQVTGGAQ